MKAKFWTSIVIVLLAIFLVGAAVSGIRFVLVDDLLARGIGLGTIVLVGIGAWVLYREISFGWHIEKLGRILESEGKLPEDTVERTPAGRPLKDQADEQFKLYAAEAEANPEDWRSWFRLSIAYDIASDRTRARRTMRQAISMFRTQ